MAANPGFHPDVVLAHVRRGRGRCKNRQDHQPARVVYVRLDSLEDYAQAFEFLGRILPRGARPGPGPGRLAMVAEVESVVAAIPKKERVSVYYAQGMDAIIKNRMATPRFMPS